MFEGDSVRLRRLEDGLVELVFDRREEAINKLDKRTVEELRQAVALIAAAADVRGVLATSTKDVFIVGADIAEFGAMFKMSHAEIAADIRRSNEVFTALEDLHVPTVAAINGYALGGGLEFALSLALRVMSAQAHVGVPEVKLGLFPGFGGTVRLPRVASVAVAIDWIASGNAQTAQAALDAGAVDEICAPDTLRASALELLRRAASGEVDWQERRRRKREPVLEPASALTELFVAAERRVAGLKIKHQPAASIATKLMQKSVGVDRTLALRLESDAFAEVALTQAASSLVETFLSEQAVKKLARRRASGAQKIARVAVLGAGIMGRGIAYANALRGVSVHLKDLNGSQLELGMLDLTRQLARQVKGGRLTQDQADKAQARIAPQLGDSGFDEVDLVIEAIVERLEVKHQVLAALEGKLQTSAVLASNTSSLRIDDIAAALTRPENFVGMHFFNPVPQMPLVEVVKGSRTSDAALSTAVGHVTAMGKTPIVVKDCPGFLVNRVLMAYTGAALRLIAAGADFVAIDRVMEAFGWPMGPAHLLDVIGIDTADHVTDVIAAGYPQRMPPIERNALKSLLSHQRLGAKSGVGFYAYVSDETGRLKKMLSSDTNALLSAAQPLGQRDYAEQDIVDRLMLPFVVEAAHALEEGVVGTPAELDMALSMALGCPAYLGGALKYADWLGLAEVVRRCDAQRTHGPMYEPTAKMREMATAGATYYG